MKKIVFAVLVLILLAFGVACSQDSDSTPTPGSVSTLEPMPISTPVPETVLDPASTGVIAGDVFIRGIAISRLFTEPFTDVLGPPLGYREAFFFYEGFEIMVVDDMVNTLWAWAPDLNLFEISGVSLDLTRAELLAAFGVPDQDSDDYSFRYQVSNPVLDYSLTIMFEDSDDNATASSISILGIDLPPPLLPPISDVAYESLRWRFGKHSIISLMPDIREWDGEMFYIFSVKYSATGEDEYKFAPVIYLYAWVNTVTGQTAYAEPYLFANIPDDMFPVPMRNGEAIAYEQFLPPYYWSTEISYQFLDINIMEIYKQQLREAGFVDHGTIMTGMVMGEDSFQSHWTYERSDTEVILTVRINHREGRDGFSIIMYVSFLGAEDN